MHFLREQKKEKQMYEFRIVEKRTCKPSGRNTALFQYKLNVNVSCVRACLSECNGTLDAARKIFNAIWMSSITREHTYESINGVLECVGYHIASLAIRTKAMIMFKKQAQLMLIRPPPPQCRSLFLLGKLCMGVDTQ